MDWLRGDSVTIINQTKPTFYYYDYNAKLTFKRSNVDSFSPVIMGGKDFFKNTYTGISQTLVVDAADKNTGKITG